MIGDRGRVEADVVVAGAVVDARGAGQPVGRPLQLAAGGRALHRVLALVDPDLAVHRRVVGRLAQPQPAVLRDHRGGRSGGLRAQPAVDVGVQQVVQDDVEHKRQHDERDERRDRRERRQPPPQRPEPGHPKR